MDSSQQDWGNAQQQQARGRENNEQYPISGQLWHPDNLTDMSSARPYIHTAWSSKPVPNLSAFQDALSGGSIPKSEATSLKNASKEVLTACTDNQNSIHVYHTTGTRDELMLLHAVIERLRRIEPQSTGPALVVIVENLKTTTFNPATAVRDLIKLATGTLENKKSDAVYNYQHVVLIINQAGRVPPDQHYNNNTPSQAYRNWRSAQQAAMNSTTSAVLGLKQITGRKRVIWHSGSYLPMLMYTLDSETRSPRVQYTAVTINGAYEVAEKHVGPLNPHLSEQLNYITASAEKLNCPIVLLDHSALGITKLKWLYDMPSLSSLWPTLIPSSCWNEDIRIVLNGIATSIFRLRASVYGYRGQTVSSYATSELKKIESSSKQWAKEVLQPASYTPDVCTTTEALRKMRFTNKLCEMPLMDSCAALFGLLVSPLGPTGNVHAVRVTLNNAARSLALSANGIVFVLKPGRGGAVALEESLLRYWGNFLDAHQRRGTVPVLPRGLALAWKDLVGVIEGQIKAMKGETRTWRWSLEGKREVEGVLKAVRGGGMTGLCKKVLAQ